MTANLKTVQLIITNHTSLSPNFVQHGYPT